MSLPEIHFQNSQFIVVKKPSGVLSVPSRMGANDSRPVLGLDLEKHLGRRIFPVHRLDFEVSGLLLFALNAEAHQWGNEIFEKKWVKKTYSAITTGAQDFSHFPEQVRIAKEKFDPFAQDQFEWSCRILKGKRRSFESEHGQNSITLAKAIERKQDQILWILNPITGRSHQLRYELSRHGFPILGDQLYGSRLAWGKADEIALRSHELDFQSCVGREKFGLPTRLSIEALCI